MEKSGSIELDGTEGVRLLDDEKIVCSKRKLLMDLYISYFILVLFVATTNNSRIKCFYKIILQRLSNYYRKKKNTQINRVYQMKQTNLLNHFSSPPFSLISLQCIGHHRTNSQTLLIYKNVIQQL